MLKCGDTFLLPKSAYHIEHLWIVLTEPEPITQLAVCVNVTSKTRYCDTTVVLKPGCHTFIKHESVINYSDARQMDIGKVYQVVTTKNPQSFAFGIYDSCSEALLSTIQAGLLKSPHVKH